MEVRRPQSSHLPERIFEAQRHLPMDGIVFIPHRRQIPMLPDIGKIPYKTAFGIIAPAEFKAGVGQQIFRKQSSTEKQQRKRQSHFFWFLSLIFNIASLICSDV